MGGPWTQELSLVHFHGHRIIILLFLLHKMQTPQKLFLFPIVKNRSYPLFSQPDENETHRHLFYFLKATFVFFSLLSFLSLSTTASAVFKEIDGSTNQTIYDFFFLFVVVFFFFNPKFCTFLLFSHDHVFIFPQIIRDYLVSRKKYTILIHFQIYVGSIIKRLVWF